MSQPTIKITSLGVTNETRFLDLTIQTPNGQTCQASVSVILDLAATQNLVHNLQDAIAAFSNLERQKSNQLIAAAPLDAQSDLEYEIKIFENGVCVDHAIVTRQKAVEVQETLNNP